MVAGPRRSRTKYAMNDRHCGKTIKDSRTSEKSLKLLANVLVPMFVQGGHANIRPVLVIVISAVIAQFQFINRWVDVPRTIFVNRHRTLATFSDADLYDLRVTKREFIGSFLVNVFPGVVRWECENNIVEDVEVGILMFLYWISFPRKLYHMQIIFGREYSQISRIMKAIFQYLNTRWGHLITPGPNNLDYFVPRLEEYNRCFLVKYQQLHGHPW